MLNIIEVLDINVCGDKFDYVVSFDIDDITKRKIQLENNFHEDIDSITCHLIVNKGIIENVDYSIYDGIGGWKDFIINAIDKSYENMLKKYIIDFIERK